MPIKTLGLMLSFPVLLAFASPAFSAGFAIIEQSVSGLGNAFAGGAASAEDASTIFFNPAGLTRLEGSQAVAGLHMIFPKTRFKGEEAKTSPALGGDDLIGGDGDQAGETGGIPNLYLATKLENGLAFGLGINAPFGLATEYTSGWQGRYHALRSDVLTINVNPAVAYKVNDKLSLGIGLNAQYIEVELTSAIDFGSIAFAQSGGALGTPQGDDGRADITADDLSYGYNLGALYEFDENSRIGIAYRSRIEHTLEGHSDFTVPSSISALPLGLGAGIDAMFADTDAKGEIALPDTASLSLYHSLNERWAVMADVTWTNWSTFDELRIEYDNPAKSDSVTTEAWDDNWRYSVGMSYEASEKLTLRAGLAFDETPIPDAEHRTPRIPGEDRFWTAFGFGYQFSDSIVVDFGYAHLFVDDSKINQQAGTDPAGENFFAGTLVGEFENSVDIASLGLTYNF